MVLYLHKCVGMHLQLHLQELNLKMCSIFLLLLGCLIEGHGKSTIMIVIKGFLDVLQYITYVQIQV